MPRKKPTTCTVGLWNVTGSVNITAHTDEAHKSVCLVDFRVDLQDQDTARDMLYGVVKILELDENQHDFLRDLLFNHRGKLFVMAREWRAEAFRQAAMEDAK